LLTYVAVEPRWRRRGVCRQLFQAALAALRRDAHTEGQDLQAVFAEMEDPVKADPNRSAMPPSERLAVLARLGAVWVQIPYVQPKLAGGADRSRHLRLLAFPPAGDALCALAGKVVVEFLNEFYRALGVDEPQTDADFRQMAEQLAANAPLCPLQNGGHP
jgi:hypothetical protein